MKKSVLVLLSGGIDSPVAAYKLIKAGYKVSLIHFHNYTAGAQQVKEKIIKLTDVLKQHQKNLSLHLIPFQEVQNEVIKFIPAKYRMLIYRRFMLRIAEEIARQEKINFLATGDSLAQVASQTLDNMRAISTAIKMEVLRPLLGFDKQEIVAIAKQIGTYEISILPYSDCCSYMVAKHPETHATLELLDKLEGNLNVQRLVESALEKKEAVD